MKVFVYYNLHRNLWSIKALEGPQKGRVVDHARNVVLHNPRPKVSPAGRERVLRDKRKNVHAGIVGDLYTANNMTTYIDHDILNGDYSEVTYNPYKYESFVFKHADCKAYIKGGSHAVMQNKKVYILGL